MSIGHPTIDPGDGRTKCEGCGKYVWPVIHSCRGGRLVGLFGAPEVMVHVHLRSGGDTVSIGWTSDLVEPLLEELKSLKDGVTFKIGGLTGGTYVFMVEDISYIEID